MFARSAAQPVGSGRRPRCDVILGRTRKSTEHELSNFPCKGWASENHLMVDVTCPRCGTKMRWLHRLNTYFCDKDGYLLGRNDPFVKKGEAIQPYNPGGQYNY